MAPLLLLLVVTVVAAVGSTAALLRRVPAGHAGVRERMGTYDETLAPGWHLKLPGDRIVLVPLAEQRLPMRRRPVVAGDGREVMAEGRIRFRIEDPFRAVTEVADVAAALESLATNTLRSYVEQTGAEQAAKAPDRLTEEVRRVLAAAANGWGVRLLGVEVVLELPG